MMSLCGWLKTFKRKGKNAVGADEDAGVRTGCDVDETREETGEADEPGPTNGKRSGGWGRKIKSVTKLVTGERREEAAPKGKDANLDENEPAGDDGTVECDDEVN
uniref:Uncharacterized protein n=1 Tax=Anopheles melas TaxID=34690 RepID=A0A182U9W7_9DIPT